MIENDKMKIVNVYFVLILMKRKTVQSAEILIICEFVQIKFGS